jgi:iron complex transport system substrate-binding protein
MVTQMNKTAIVAIVITALILSAAVIGYSQNWFQPTTNTQPNTTQPTATPQATSSPQPTATPQATTSPEPTSTPQPTESPQPTSTPQPIVASLNLVLEIYGNANMDDKIDANDIEYVRRINNGTASTTRFADANNDGTIDQQDIDQINSIINGNATKLTLLDGNGNVITVSLPVNRIVIEYIQNAELVRVLGIENKVVGIDFAVEKLKSIYFPENADRIVSVGQLYTPDYELVLSLNPDMLLTFSNTPSAISEKASKLPGVDVVFLGLYYPNVTHPEASAFFQGILKAGYIFNKVDKATEYANWLLNLINTIRDRTSTLTESQKQKVLLTNYPYTTSTTIKAYATLDTLGQVCILAGGANIAASLPTYFNSSSVNIDAEWIIQQNPDYIFLHTVRYTFSGVMNADPAQGMDVDDVTSIRNCLQNYTSQPMFASVNAFKNNHVYIIAGDFRNNAMGGVLGAVYLSKVLYPDLFSDWNPQTIHQEYITRFLRLNYNLDEHGVFLYPTLSINGDTVGAPNGAQ